MHRDISASLRDRSGLRQGFRQGLIARNSPSCFAGYCMTLASAPTLPYQPAVAALEREATYPERF